MGMTGNFIFAVLIPIDFHIFFLFCSAGFSYYDFLEYNVLSLHLLTLRLVNIYSNEWNGDSERIRYM